MIDFYHAERQKGIQLQSNPYNIPNLISLARLLIVPYIVWLLLDDDFALAFYLIVAVSISDAIDGFIARRLNCQTIIGHYLDPIADKALLVALYVTLSYKGFIPIWLVITIVSRDALIIGGILISNILNKYIKIRPIMISKVNTVFQILLIVYVLIFHLMGSWQHHLVQDGALVLYTLTFLSTFASGITYIGIWLRNIHKSS